MVFRDSRAALRGVPILVLVALVVTACAGTASPPTVPVVKILGNSNAVSLAVADQEGLYEGVDVQVERATMGDQNSLFFAGDYQVNFGMATWEVAQFVSQGEDLRYFATVGSAFMYNGIIVRAEDAETYKTLSDLEGKKLGIPGFGTGTYAAFTVLANQLYGIEDVTETFEIVEADGGALLALLERGELEGTLNFGEQTLAALVQPEKFKIIFSFTEEQMKAVGQPMVISGLSARTGWLEENTELAKAIVAGSQRGLEWMRDNPTELTTGGKYAEWFDASGVLADPNTSQAVMSEIQEGRFFSPRDTYNQAWIDSQYEFIKGGVPALLETVPPKDEIFFPPERLQ